MLAGEIKSAVGDGVKTGIIVAEKLLTSIHQSTKGNQPEKHIVDSVRNALDIAIENLITRSDKIFTPHQLIGAATTAAKDPIIGNRVVEALNKVQDKELIFVFEHADPVSKLEISDKHEFDFGYISQSFATDLETDFCILENCCILLYLHKISAMRDILPFLESAAKQQRPILIIAEDIEGEALDTIKVNTQRGTIQCCAIRIPSLRTSNRDATMEKIEDFAALTKSTIFSSETSRTPNNWQESDFGLAEKVIISRNTTQIIGKAGLEADISLRIRRIRQELNSGVSEGRRHYLKSRLASLLGKAAFIKIGSSSNFISREEIYQTFSALSAITKLIEEGWVVGGGKTFLEISEHLNKVKPSSLKQALGFNAVIDGLRQPYATLTMNGQEDNASYSQNLIENNIIDSVKILRRVLELVRDHVCIILETEKWEISPRTVRNWSDADDYFNS